MCCDEGQDPQSPVVPTVIALIIVIMIVIMKDPQSTCLHARHLLQLLHQLAE